MRIFSGIVLLVLTAQVFAQAQPNVLLIIADDLGVDRLRGYHDGALMANTPTLDSLRAAGITFTNAWAAPVCSPSRAALMTGQYGIKNGVTGVPGNLPATAPSLFREIDARTNDAYDHALIGKWHLSSRAEPDDPSAFGMDFYTGFLSGAVEDYSAWTRVENGVAALSSDYATSALTDASLAWVGAQTRPWFLWLAHGTPHSPYHVPPAGTFTIGNTGGNTNKYVAMIENLDYEVGRLLGGLAPEVRENTLVFFIGDNGTPSNVMQDYPAGRGKNSLYQGGLRVPLIVAGKGVARAGAREDALVHFADLHATILEAAGAELPGGLFNSLSFYPLLTGEEAETRDYNYIDLGVGNVPADVGFAIRNQRYKLIEFTDGSQEFYDLGVDSFEFNDLLLSPPLSSEAAEVKADLEAEATVIRNGWSCRDHIRNGAETGVDCGTEECGVCTTGTRDTPASPEVLLYPNPASKYFVVDALGRRIGSVRLFDLNGRLIHQQPGLGMRILEVSLTSFKPGAYLVEIHTEAGGTKVMRTVVR